jgi:EpsI family protein
MGSDRLSAWARGGVATLQRSPATLAAFAALAIAFLCYGATFAALAAEWSRSDTYSLGYLVPWISLYLAWTQRARLRSVRLRPSPLWGGILVGLALAAKVIGFAGGATVIEGLSLIPLLAGAFLLFGGVSLLRAVLLPLLYLLFMIPFWDPILARLHPPFRLFSAWVGVHILSLIGVPATAEGFFVHLPGITLHVAELCSGVNSLIAVTAIAIPLGWTTFPDWQRRAALVGLGAVVALVFNALRVALVGILVYVYGTHVDPHGPGHALQGMAVASAGYVVLFVATWALARFGSRRSRAAGSVTGGNVAPDQASRARPIGTATTLSIALLAVFAWQAVLRPVPVPLSHPLSSLPLQLGSWAGGEGGANAIPLAEIPGSDRLERAYSPPSRYPANVLVLYVADQSGRSELVGYRTTPLLRDGADVTLRSPKAGPVQVRRSEAIEGDRSTVTYAWYDIDGYVTGSPMNAKLRTAWNVLSGRRSNGALIAVRAEYPRDKTRMLEPELRALAVEILDSLRAVLPGARS